jgi:hypothetical protein
VLYSDFQGDRMSQASNRRPAFCVCTLYEHSIFGPLQPSQAAFSVSAAVKAWLAFICAGCRYSRVTTHKHLALALDCILLFKESCLTSRSMHSYCPISACLQLIAWCGVSVRRPVNPQTLLWGQSLKISC